MHKDYDMSKSYKNWHCSLSRHGDIPIGMLRHVIMPIKWRFANWSMFKWGGGRFQRLLPQWKLRNHLKSRLNKNKEVLKTLIPKLLPVDATKISEQNQIRLLGLAVEREKNIICRLGINLDLELSLIVSISCLRNFLKFFSIWKLF